MSETRTSTEPSVPTTMHITAPIVDAPAPVRVTEDSPPPGSDANEQRERPENPNEIRMREIYENRDKQLAKELMYGQTLDNESNDRTRGVEVGTTERELSDAEAARLVADLSQKDAQTRRATKPADVQQPVTGVTEQRRSVNLNGTIVELTDAEIHQLATLGAQAMLQQQQQPRGVPIVQQPMQQQTQRQMPPVSIDDNTAREIHRSLSYGNEDESIAAIRRLALLTAQQAQPQIDQNQIIAAARDQALAQFRAEQQQQITQQNLMQVGNEYPEIFSNKRYAQMAALALTDLRQRDQLTGRVVPDIQLYREACKEVSEQFGIKPATQQQSRSASGESNGVTSVTQPNQSASHAAQGVRTSIDARHARKRVAPQTVTGANRTATLSDNSPRPMTQSEIVAQMRAARGQPSVN